MKKIKIILIVLFSLALGFLIAQNTHPIEVNFLWYSKEVPAIMPFLIAAVVSFFLGVIVTILSRRSIKSKNNYEGDSYE